MPEPAPPPPAPQSEETTLALASPAATEALAARLAPHLRAGDVLLLEGPIGAGKTHFARALIGALQRAAGQPAEEVPSPSFTLVQGYAAGDLEIWHADLYRLSDCGELAELGLETAFGTALVLVEWPDRLGRPPPQALTLRFADLPQAGEEARQVTLLPAGARGAELAAHALA
jgi:tRNA threonylcarbamoyladenosine biosynthesis protein TsaE